VLFYNTKMVYVNRGGQEQVLNDRGLRVKVEGSDEVVVKGSVV